MTSSEMTIEELLGVLEGVEDDDAFSEAESINSDDLQIQPRMTHYVYLHQNLREKTRPSVPPMHSPPTNTPSTPSTEEFDDDGNTPTPEAFNNLGNTPPTNSPENPSTPTPSEQIQSNENFGPSTECAKYFSPGILSGLLVTSMCLAILAYGIVCMMEINTNDRYEDPQSKPMVHPDN